MFITRPEFSEWLPPLRATLTAPVGEWSNWRRHSPGFFSTFNWRVLGGGLVVNARHS